jgi:hypothetical protein
MFNNLTWDAILQQWPWFGSAAAVFVIAVGLLIALKPKSNQQGETAAEDEIGWMLTGRIDFADPRAVGQLVLEVEETRSITGPSGVEHREIRWRRATVEEAKTVLTSYNAQRNLAMTAIFTVHKPTGTKPMGRGQGERISDELADATKGHDMAEV